eukprot:COSAG01_NODE_63395_length_280_cov_0.596685_1_plen_28_part_10
MGLPSPHARAALNVVKLNYDATSHGHNV